MPAAALTWEDLPVTTTAPHTQSADTQAGSWRQLLLTINQPAHVDTLLIELAPVLHAVGQRGPGCWWIRKGDTLRLRLWHPDPDDVDQITAAARQHGAQIHPGIYEPETHGFGGEAGIRVAHRVACHDAHHLAGHLARHRRHHHRHEMFLVLATRLMRAAGLDLEEQWGRVVPRGRPPAAARHRSGRHPARGAAPDFRRPGQRLQPPVPGPGLVRRIRDGRA